MSVNLVEEVEVCSRASRGWGIINKELQGHLAAQRVCWARARFCCISLSFLRVWSREAFGVAKRRRRRWRIIGRTVKVRCQRLSCTG